MTKKIHYSNKIEFTFIYQIYKVIYLKLYLFNK